MVIKLVVNKAEISTTRLNLLLPTHVLNDLLLSEIHRERECSLGVWRIYRRQAEVPENVYEIPQTFIKLS